MSSEDLVKCLIKIVISSNNKCEIYNIGSDKAISISGKVTAVSDSIVTIDQTIICNFKSTDSSINKEQTISVKGRLVGFDDLLGELKLDQCSVNK
jgi:nucleoside-diphosphate-sugar epimerase